MSRLRPGAFLGEVREQYVARAAVLTRLRHTVGRRLPRHVHGAPYLSLLIRGGYREETARGTLEYDPLTLVFHPEETSHRDEIGPEGGTFFMIELSDMSSNDPVSVQGPESSLAALRLYQQLSMGALDELSVDSALPLLVTHHVDGPRPPWLARVVDRLHDEFNESFAVSALAEDAGVHTVHLARVFRKYMGSTIGEYVTRLRVTWVAKQLTLQENVCLSELASAAGFADQSHMTRVFKLLTGCPPGKSRQILGLG